MPSSACQASPDCPNDRKVMLLALAELPPMSMVLRTPGACCSSAKNPTRPVGYLEHLGRQARARRGGRHVHHRCRAADGDRFLQRADLQLHVDARREPARQAQPLAPQRLEPGQLVAHVEGADRQRRQPILATAVGDGTHFRNLERGALRRHRHAGQRRPALVQHLAGDASVLGNGTLRPDHEHDEDEKAKNCTSCQLPNELHHHVGLRRG